MATMLKRGLEEDVATDGPDGVWQATEFSHDAIIMDVMLPGLDGFETCKQIRAADCWAPVLMLTARHEVADRVRGLDSGADDYLTKPFAPKELSARIRALLRRRNPNAGPQLQVQDVTMDDATREVRRDGRAIELSAREFDLLAFLVAHPRQVFTRAQLIEQVWSSSHGWQSEATVTEHIHRLRHKVGAEQLVTVRGVGYRSGP